MIMAPGKNINCEINFAKTILILNKPVLNTVKSNLQFSFSQKGNITYSYPRIRHLKFLCLILHQLFHGRIHFNHNTASYRTTTHAV